MIEQTKLLEPTWLLTSMVQPPSDEWFFGRYVGGEVMPTYIIAGITCISVRVAENEIKIVQHTLALPAEWRP